MGQPCVVVREQHVVRPDLVAFARAIPIESVLLLLVFELAYVAL